MIAALDLRRVCACLDDLEKQAVAAVARFDPEPEQPWALPEAQRIWFNA